jgi:hypothetical protein
LGNGGVANLVPRDHAAKVGADGVDACGYEQEVTAGTGTRSFSALSLRFLLRNFSFSSTP